MPNQRIGVAVSAPNVAAVMENIERAEAAGVPAVWLTTGGSRRVPTSCVASPMAWR